MSIALAEIAVPYSVRKNRLFVIISFLQSQTIYNAYISYYFISCCILYISTCKILSIYHILNFKLINNFYRKPRVVKCVYGTTGIRNSCQYMHTEFHYIIFYLIVHICAINIVFKNLPGACAFRRYDRNNMCVRRDITWAYCMQTLFRRTSLQLHIVRGIKFEK